VAGADILKGEMK